MLARKNNSGQRGHAIIEVSLMAPWVFFLFVGTLDFGFYAYASIATENAARVAVAQTSHDVTTAVDTATACTYALGEMKSLPNMKGVSTCAIGTLCATSPTAVSASQPVGVSVCQLAGPDGAAAAQVSVTYQTILMIPIPGLLSGQVFLTRTAQMRVVNQ
jgi:hypothetical protein